MAYKIYFNKKNTIDFLRIVYYTIRALEILGILAQLGEHLPYKQRVTGSSPVGPIFSIKHMAE